MRTNQSLHRRSLLMVMTTAIVGSGCATVPNGNEIRTESSVDLERFMGDWYVIASIPTFIEKEAHNATETYELDDDGTIATTFSFRKGSFDGEKKTYTPRGFIRDTKSNAIWGMRFVWPIKADYRIVYVNEDYTQTIIGRNKRDFVWIMARSPSISSEHYFDHVRLLREQGYDTTKIKMVPQQWEEAPADSAR